VQAKVGVLDAALFVSDVVGFWMRGLGIGKIAYRLPFLFSQQSLGGLQL
jgi:hypothetical protein